MTKTVVITGSTRGIGHGLAREFLKLGCNVVVSGRAINIVEDAVIALSAANDAERVHGQACNVVERDQVQRLWDAAVERYGVVDIWINNAGMRPTRELLWLHSEKALQQVLDVNLLGTLHGCAVAIPAMQAQGQGAVYNMEGMGSDGRMVVGSTLYGTTKSAITYLTGSLAKEVEGSGVIVGALSPGMVVTNLLVGDYDRTSEDWQRNKRVFNILADKVETVTPWLARQALANSRNGAQLAWLTPRKAAWRFATSAFNKRDLFAEEG